MTSTTHTEGRCSTPAGVAGVAWLLLMVVSSLAFAGPATKPTVSDQQLSQWVTDLDSRSAETRQTAASAMMFLIRDDLPELKAIVEKSQPLSPAQAQVLHDVVTHVFLSGEPYNKVDKLGFLGMRMAQLNTFGVDPKSVGQGIVVQSRMPGFGSYRSLLDGDVILSIVERPNVWLSDTPTFAALIRECEPGTKLHLLVIRQGHQITVPVTVDARPSELQVNVADPNSIEDFNAARLQLSEFYWQKQFAPLVAATVSQAE